MVKKKKSKKKEKVCEVFEIEKDGKKEVKEICGVEKEKPTSKSQIKKENKILRNVLIGIGIFVILLLLGVLFIYSVRNINYEGVKFEIVKEGELILYQTSLPVIYQGNIVPYNIYFRNDPRKLKDVEFNDELVLFEDIVINSTEDFKCEGMGVIAIANFVKVNELLGMKVIKDGNASCDENGMYSFIQLQPGNVTNIKKVGPSCYNLNVNDCEILEVTERFMLEELIKYNELN